MTFLKQRFNSLKILKWFFLGSMCVSALALLMAIVALGLDAAGLTKDNPNIQAITYIDKSIAILRVLVFIVAAVILFFGRKYSKESKIGFYLVAASAVLLLISVILALTVYVPYLNQILAIVGCTLYVVGIYLFYNALLLTDFKERQKNPFHQVVVFALILLLINQALMFVAITFRISAAFNVALSLIALTAGVIGNLLLFFSTGQIVKKVREEYPEIKEEK